jgi:hypothetical protein
VTELVVISGGQTGVDRGGLDAAIDLGIRHGGWCPQGRKAEDGRIPDKYKVKEMAGGYAARTRANVRLSTLTLAIVPEVEFDDDDIARPKNASPGTALTIRCCEEEGRRLQVLAPGQLIMLDCVASLIEHVIYVEKLERFVLNVAGPRESVWRGAQEIAGGLVRSILRRLSPPVLGGPRA